MSQRALDSLEIMNPQKRELLIEHGRPIARGHGCAGLVGGEVPGGAFFGPVPVPSSTIFQASRNTAIARMLAVPSSKGLRFRRVMRPLLAELTRTHH